MDEDNCSTQYNLFKVLDSQGIEIEGRISVHSQYSFHFNVTSYETERVAHVVFSDICLSYIYLSMIVS